ncbi:MAG TPA: tRNA (cytidine(34)-2'-O)-methyltransferase [Bdellovibrionales bacterium]|nr:tRNA (cytidine(34)-2'-O)-methyltransferase [Bdellovibrionales bacterium]
MSKEIPDRFFNIVLIEPEIPNNTGNIGRTCVGTNSRLHLVGKLGFEISDRYLKRAGLDYWKDVDWVHHKTWDDWWALVKDPARVFYFSTKARKSYFDVDFRYGDWFVFGKETKGLDEDLLRKNDAQALTIPQFGPIRSLNVANAVSIVVYEAIRQLKPPQGKL